MECNESIAYLLQLIDYSEIFEKVSISLIVSCNDDEDLVNIIIYHQRKDLFCGVYLVFEFLLCCCFDGWLLLMFQ